MIKTKNFTWGEFIFSQTAARLGIDNDVPPALVGNAAITLAKLQAIRSSGLFGDSPIRITSGYRSPELNKAIPGSSQKSDHMLAYAVDIKVDGYSPLAVSLKLSECLERFGITQLIYEFNSWTHLSFNPVDYGSSKILTIGKHTGNKYFKGIIKE